LPGRAHFRAVVGTVMNTIVRGVLRVRSFGGDDCEFAVEGERVDAADKAGFLAGELTDLGHGKFPVVGGGHACQCLGARHSKRPSPFSSVQSGSARPMTELAGMGPKYRPSRLSGTSQFIRKISLGAMTRQPRQTGRSRP